MRQPLIVMPLHELLEPEVLNIARAMLPAGFQLDVVSPAELAQTVRDADYLMGLIGPLADETLGNARQLRLVQLLSAGYDGFNLRAARAMSVPVAVNGGANAIAVAEHAIMLMLATFRRLTEHDADVRGGRWAKGRPRLDELCGATVGIVGMGQIGREVAQRLRGWGTTLLYHDPVHLTSERERELGVRRVPLEELLRQADLVTLHLPLNDATRHIIDARALALMKPTAVLVNTARGGLVEEGALSEALQSGRLGGAGLDVLAQQPPPVGHPLLSTPNTVLTPHVAGPTWQSWPRRFENAFTNIARVHRGERPQWVVPELRDLAGSDPNQHSP